MIASPRFRFARRHGTEVVRTRASDPWDGDQACRPTTTRLVMPVQNTGRGLTAGDLAARKRASRRTSSLWQDGRMPSCLNFGEGACARGPRGRRRGTCSFLAQAGGRKDCFIRTAARVAQGRRGTRPPRGDCSRGRVTRARAVHVLAAISLPKGERGVFTTSADFSFPPAEVAHPSAPPVTGGAPRSRTLREHVIRCRGWLRVVAARQPIVT